MTFILARGRHAFISRDVPEDAVRSGLAEGSVCFLVPPGAAPRVAAIVRGPHTHRLHRP